MVYKRKTRFRRKRRFIRRYRKKRVSSERVKLFKIRKIVNVVISAAGGNNITTINDDPSLSQDWINIVGLFDMYRTAGIKAHFVPSTNTREAPTSGGGFGFRPVYCAHDTDLVVGAVTPNTIIQYENMKIKNSFMPWVYYRKMPRRITTTGQSTLDGRGYLSTHTPQATQQLIMLFDSANSPAQHQLGTLVITHYVCARNRN